MYVTLILACTVGGALAATVAPPAICCTDREFEVTMGEVGGTMYNDHGHYVQSFIQGFNKVYYDAHTELMAVEAVITTNGITVTSNLVFDYPNKRMYLSYQNGTCIRYPLVQAFRQPCLPSDSVFDGYSTMGYGVLKLELVSWRYIEPGTDHVIKMSLTKEGCVPVVLANLGHYANDTVLADTFFLYNNFSPSISKRSVFRRPSGCTDGGTFNPQVVGRSLRGVREAFIPTL